MCLEPIFCDCSLMLVLLVCSLSVFSYIHFLSTDKFHTSPRYFAAVLNKKNLNISKKMISFHTVVQHLSFKGKSRLFLVFHVSLFEVDFLVAISPLCFL